MERIQEEYISIARKNTELFSTADADTLLENLVQAATTQGIKCNVAPNTYKVKMVNDIEDGSCLRLTAKILKTGEGNCVEFSKNEGNKFYFMD